MEQKKILSYNSYISLEGLKKFPKEVIWSLRNQQHHLKHARDFGWMSNPTLRGKTARCQICCQIPPVLSCTRVCVVTHSLNHQHYHTVQVELTSSSLKVIEL